MAAMNITSSSSCIHPFFSLIILFLLPLALPLSSADPDPLQDFCVADLKATITVNGGFPCKPASEVTSDDFFFDGLSKEGNITILGATVALATVQTFPGLNTLGLSWNRADVSPGGLILPHTHPRATETGIVVKGKLLAGFVTTGDVFYSKILTEGEMFVFPVGLLHFLLNVGKGKAMFYTAFNSQLPGTVNVQTNLFASHPSIPDEVLRKAFRVEEDVIRLIRSKFTS